MAGLTLTFLGSGDAFGSGGRLQTCMHVDVGIGCKFLIDCGATAMIGIRKFNIEPNEITNIFISHMHGDHFAGICFFILDAQLVSKRTQPLTIFLPTGGKDKLITAMDTLFPGSYSSPKKFALEIIEMAPEEKYNKDGIEIITYQVNHSGLDARALRISAGERTVAYSGDTQWDDKLIDCAAGADLFITEAYSFDRKVKFHLDLASLKENIDKIQAKQYLLTHMSAEMLTVPKYKCMGFDLAYDGKVVKL